MQTTTRRRSQSTRIAHLTPPAPRPLAEHTDIPSAQAHLRPRSNLDPPRVCIPSAGVLAQLLELVPHVDQGGVDSVLDRLGWVILAGRRAGATTVVLDALADHTLAAALRERAFARVISAVRAQARSAEGAQR